MLSRRVPHDPTPNAWSRLLAERRAAGSPLIDLTEANPTRVGLGGAGAGELAALGDPGGARYEPDPRGLEVARDAVAAYYRDRGLTADRDAAVLTSGTSESYAHLFRLLADPGDRVLVPAPSYPLFEPLAALEGVTLRSYRVAWDGDWHLDLGSLEAAMEHRPRAMIVVQPNHPTGSCFDAAELGAAERLCELHGVAIISDEVFADFPWPRAGAATRPDAPGLPSLLGDRGVPTFVLSGLSKVCGMPQLKLGWIAVAGPAPARAAALRGLEWIADLFLSVGTPVQAALPRLLGGRHPWQDRVRERIGINLARVGETIRRRPEIDLLAGVGGWVAVLRVPRARGEEAWTLELLRRGVVVHPGQFYDMEGEAYLVVSLIVPQEAFARGLAAIETLVGEG
jgi:aspartate/methionine/tyrosine aminotransferase